MNQFIEALVNEECLLQVALYVATKIQEEENPIRVTADQIIVGYILQSFVNEGKPDFTEEEVGEKYVKITTDFLLTNMVRDDILEAELNDDGEFVYKLSTKGKAIADEIRRRD